MMRIGSQNVNVEVVHYQVTVGLFSRPLGLQNQNDLCPEEH